MKQNKSILILLSILFIFSSTFASQKKVEKVPRPKLVVGIMVDQMRWDYLYRFYDRYGPDGFKRLLNEGFSNENTYINHLPTVTGIGHSTVYTGTVPAIHGITGNSITFNSTGKTVNCVGDEAVQSVGTDSNVGMKSPVNMLTSTIGDELKIATNFRAKVIGISLKDRGAILPAGHAADAAYWFDTVNGRWVTSTYYMNQLPAWVNKFNGLNLAKKYLDGNWNTLYKIDTYKQSTADNMPYEGMIKGQDTPTFPVMTSKFHQNKDFSAIYSTPFGNSITLDFAKEAIAKENLGQGEDTDLLAVSLSSTDAVGHTYGINSIELEDTYLRLDQDLATFFDYLDKTQGKGNYTVFLTADHGAGHNSQFLEDNKLPTFPTQADLKKDLNSLLREKFEVEDLVTSVGYSQVRFDYKKIKESKLSEEAIRDACMEYLRREPEVIFAADMNKIGDASIPEELKTRMINGHHPDRSGGIQFILNPNSRSLKSKGSGHSDWNAYDAKIPLVWMGWGIKKGGKSFKQAHMIDIAPTVSSLLRIPTPNGNIGKALEEVLILD